METNINILLLTCDLNGHWCYSVTARAAFKALKAKKAHDDNIG